MRAYQQISVVIPTRNRPELVVRALRSALAQTLPPLEVLVIIDGRDSATEERLHEFDDPRLAAIMLEESVGGAEARNLGVRCASGEWIAFLDDDDEWLPNKLEVQMALASRSQYRFPIISSRIIARTPLREFIWPRTHPGGRHISEYLFARGGLFQGEGLLATPTLVVRRALAQTVRFTPGLKKHQDWDWILRALAEPGAGLEFAPEPLAVCYMDDASRTSVSRTHDWEFSLGWIRQRRGMVTPRAYAAFLLTVVGSQAARQHATRAFLPLIREAARVGKPRPFDFTLYVAMWAIPQGVRHRIRAALAGLATA